MTKKKKEFTHPAFMIDDDPLGGVRVIDGRVQVTTTVPTSPGIGLGPNKVESGVASHGEAEVTSVGALKVME